ncbi:hypothetical protein ABK54_004995, partial [Salmonella enterica subsp. enterica serovar Shubra]|nr:hypothetical protein [Salmonella enterica subsp. enterica serovar Shubra]
MQHFYYFISARKGYRIRRHLLAALMGATLAGISFMTSADVNNDLNKFFNKLGFEGNATRAAV